MDLLSCQETMRHFFTKNLLYDTIPKKRTAMFEYRKAASATEQRSLQDRAR